MRHSSSHFLSARRLVKLGLGTTAGGFTSRRLASSKVMTVSILIDLFIVGGGSHAGAAPILSDFVDGALLGLP